MKDFLLNQAVRFQVAGGHWADRQVAKLPGTTTDVAALEMDGESGSTTVEYAIGAIATAGFAGLLVAVLKSGGIKGLIQNIIETALAL